MAMTIIAVYDEFPHAYSAKNELIATGFSRRQVQLNPDQETTAPARRPPPGAGARDGSVTGTVGNIFSSLLGVGDKSTHSNVYAEAVRRGGYVLTVDVDDDAQRVRAEDIMDHFGPIDVEERSADWIRHGWRGHDPSTPLGGGKVRKFEHMKPDLGQK